MLLVLALGAFALGALCSCFQCSSLLLLVLLVLFFSALAPRDLEFLFLVFLVVAPCSLFVVLIFGVPSYAIAPFFFSLFCHSSPFF